MKRLAIISHNSFRAIAFHKSRSPSSPYGPAPQGSQLIMLYSCTVVHVEAGSTVKYIVVQFYT